MNFASDNTSGAHPAIMAAVVQANEGYAKSYGADALSLRAAELLRQTFEADDAAVWLVPTGTAANALALATFANPFDAIFCTEVGHINVDECNAPEFYTGGAKLITVPHRMGKITPGDLRRSVLGEETRGAHGAKRGPVSITSVTEEGAVYTTAEIAAIAAVCQEFNLPLHLDGARFANAAAHLSVSASQMSWRAGVDAVSFGGSKNGCLGVEAVVFFDAEAAWQFERRRKRGGHLFSKHRFLAAQMVAYLEDGLWLELAAHANAMGQRLLRGLAQISEVELPEASLNGETPANILFPRFPQALHEKMHAAGADYYVWSGNDEDTPETLQTARLVTSWATTEADVDRFLELLRAG